MNGAGGPETSPGNGSSGDDERPGDADTEDHTPADVTGIGLAIAALVVVGMLVPIRDGTVHLAILLGLVTAAIPLGYFLARRHTSLERHYGRFAAASSALAAVCAGYALTQGITGATEVWGLGGAVPAVGLALGGAGLTGGVAIADYGRVSAVGLLGRISVTGRLSLVALAAWIAGGFATVFFFVLAAGLLGELTSLQEDALGRIGFAVGVASIAVGYVLLTERGLEFFDLRVPTARELLWVVGGVVVLFAVNIAISVLFTAGNVDTAEHTAVQEAAANPELLYVVIPASILIVGPFEELLYRNVIQKSMYDVFSPLGAIIVSSVIFAGVHLPALSGTGMGEAIAGLTAIFGLSLILGTIYYRTGNLVVPAIIHGCYNAIVFASVVM